IEYALAGASSLALLPLFGCLRFLGKAALAGGGNQVRRQLHALCLTPAESGCGLSQAKITQPDLLEDTQLVCDLGLAGQELQRLADGEVQHLMNVFSLVTDLQYAGLIACAFALFADQLHVGQKLHLDGDGSIALAGLTAAAGDVEREMPGGVAALLCLRDG